tara:strand:- start:104 stop:460 length:357 start_codon:yes stop_codon:yes gene_type:complete
MTDVLWGYDSMMIDFATLYIEIRSTEELEAFLGQLERAEIEIREISRKLHDLSETGDLPELVISGKNSDFDLDLEFEHTVDPSILDPLRERLFELMTPPWEGRTTDHLRWGEGGPLNT